MSTKPFKRYLIHQDEETLKEIIAELRHYLPSLKALKKAYDALQLEGADFDFGVFEHIKTSGVSQITASYSKQLNTELDKTGVVNVKLREIVLQGAFEPSNNLDKAYRELVSIILPEPNTPYGKPIRTERLKLSHIDFIDGDFTVSDINKEQILELCCRVYVEDEQQDFIYKNLIILREQFLHYDKWMTQLGLPRSMYGGHFTDNVDHFFAFDRETRELNIIPSNIKWAQGFKGYQEMMQAKYNQSITRI